MYEELITKYDNPQYPVSVVFLERKKSEGAHGVLGVRSDAAEFLIVNNGELRVTVNDVTKKVIAGQGIYINVGVPHRLTSSTNEDTSFFSVVFSPAYALDISEDNFLAEKYYYPIVREKKLAFLSLDEANLRDEAVLDRINDIIAANTMKKSGYEILTKGYICMLWCVLLDVLKSEGRAFNGKNIPSQDELRVRSAISYMESNYADPISLDDISEKVHISRNECCRCFKRVMGISPIDYLIRLRVFLAAKVLYKDPVSVDSISELAMRCGFNNTSYFNRAFKKYFECTPTEFTKMLKNDSDRAKVLFDAMQESVTNL